MIQKNFWQGLRQISVSILTIASATLTIAPNAAAQAAAARKTQNVIVVIIDGMRWQEVFKGVDPELIKTVGPAGLPAGKERAAYAEKLFARSSQSESRTALMPFLWNEIAAHGQLFGNRDLGSDSHVTNGFNFSYPGYNETLTGSGDPRINSNDNIPNPNVTVFEWLNKKAAFHGHVAAFGAWEDFNGIFNKARCGFPVNASYDAFTDMPATPELTLLNHLKTEGVRIWPDEVFDPPMFYTALEYVKYAKPRVLFIGLGETDDWAHAASYAEYLNSANRSDAYLAALWNLVQSMPEYKDKTTLVVLPDHGRGNGAKWTDHGQDIPESSQTWMAWIGPDTKPLGERKSTTPVTESEVAATLAALLGEDYHAAIPNSGAAIHDVLPQ
ncbi:alkaline phosphatase family protein [Acidicapsa ligni]|uniref:hypothetical protein n=1 Tax=Acidicapsa ligni TaxID=542300 RepID=UPI0021E02492|nr:hypothetical protein [Acidicapsa ligni]